MLSAECRVPSAECRASHSSVARPARLYCGPGSGDSPIGTMRVVEAPVDVQGASQRLRKPAVPGRLIPRGKKAMNRVVGHTLRLYLVIKALMSYSCTALFSLRPKRAKPTTA